MSKSTHWDRIQFLSNLIDTTDDVLELKAIQNELEEIHMKITLTLRDLDDKLKKLLIQNKIKQITRIN